MLWEYECECGASVVSGFADFICPRCGEVMRTIAGPEPSDEDVEDMLDQAERILADNAG